MGSLYRVAPNERTADGMVYRSSAKRSAMQRAANINPSMLAWARQAAGLSEEQAARSVGLSTSQRSTAVDKLLAFESGKRHPTRGQLMRFADIYHRPPTVFYLASAPASPQRGEDFRTLSGPPPSRREAALLDALLRTTRVQQNIVKAILEDDEDMARPSFEGKLALDDAVPVAVEKLRDVIDVPSSDDRNRLRSDDAFKFLRTRVERAGAFVLLAGDLGSHHTAISERVFRGFALVDPVAPFVVINSQDSRTARSFTLLHELGHVCLGITGVSADPPSRPSSRAHDRIEFFCNDVASEFLLPSDAVSLPRKMIRLDDARQLVGQIAQDWRVSEAMVAYRLWRAERIERDIYGRLHAFYASRWQEEKDRNRAQMAEREGGPSYYAVRRSQLGRALLSFARHRLQTEELSHTKAARILGVKPGNVRQLLDVANPSSYTTEV